MYEQIWMTERKFRGDVQRGVEVQRPVTTMQVILFAHVTTITPKEAHVRLRRTTQQLDSSVPGRQVVQFQSQRVDGAPAVTRIPVARTGTKE